MQLTGQSLKEQIEKNKKLKPVKETPGPSKVTPPGPRPGGGDMMEEIRRKAAERNKKKSAEAEGSANDHNTDNNA